MTRGREEREPSPARWRMVIIGALIVPAIATWMTWRFMDDRQAGEEASAPLLSHAPLTATLALPTSRTSGDLTLYQFPAPIRQAYIHDIVVEDERLWIGSGNRIALSARAVWLASASSSTPLIRIDRATHDRTDIAGIPDEYYVGAIGVDGDVIWLGLYRKNWADGTYTVNSLLAKYFDSSD